MNNCRFEIKNLAELIEFETEEFDIETDEIKKVSECKALPEKKTLIKKVKDCKPFIGVSVLFLCVSIILIGIIIYFYLKSKNNVLPY